jgi:hypothetical protein
VNATREKEVLGPQPRDFDPLLDSLTGRGRDLELDRSLRLVLHHDSPRGQLLAVANVPDLEGNEGASTKLAVDPQIEEREFAHPVFHLESNTECPDVLGLERSFLADDLALVPWLAVNGVGYGCHDGLPSS